jgi:hypothetical protein
MKMRGKTIVMTLAIAIAFAGAMKAQRGMRGQMADSTRKGMYGDQMMRHKQMPTDSVREFMMQRMNRMGMHGGMWHSPMHRGYQGFYGYPRMQWGPRPGWGWNGPGWYGRPGYGPRPPLMRHLESVPNLTEKQKKDIADLNKKHQEEMQKFREETSKKVSEMRDSHRKKLMDLLTDEQKKYIEGNTTPAPPVKK